VTAGGVATERFDILVLSTSKRPKLQRLSYFQEVVCRLTGLGLGLLCRLLPTLRDYRAPRIKTGHDAKALAGEGQYHLRTGNSGSLTTSTTARNYLSEGPPA
jgi:hypothetical protein